jgi:hypothetical protein
LKRNHLHRLLLLFSRFFAENHIFVLTSITLTTASTSSTVTMIILFDYGLFRGEMCVVLCLGIFVSLKKRD